MTKLKSAVIGFSYLAGLIFAFLLSGDLVFNVIVLVTGVVAGVLLTINNPRSSYYRDVGLFFIVFGIAFGVFGFYKATTLDFIAELDGQKREITGIVTDKTSPSHDMAGLTIETVIDGVKVGFSLYAPDTGADIGDEISFNAAFNLLRDNTAFAESSYYMSKGIFLKATANSTPQVEKAEQGLNPLVSFKSALSEFNQSLKSKVMTEFPGDVGGLVCAVFFGDKSYVSPELSKSITRAGASHYTSVSGLHFTLLAHLFMSVLGFSRLGFMARGKVKFLSLVVLILTFMVFFNLSPSVIRAGIMLIIFYGGELFMRRGNTLNSIGIAALVILIASPFACLDAGFLFSVAGTVGIGVIAPKICKRLQSNSRFSRFRDLFIFNLCANYATLPLAAIFFGGVSLLSPVTSILILPLFTIMVTAGFAFAVSSLAHLGGFSLLIMGLSSKLMGVIITFFGGFKFAYMPLDYSFVISWIVASLVFVISAGLFYKNILKSAKACVISLLSLAMMIVTFEYLDLENTRLEIYTDGSSAAIFLRYKNTSAVIITDDGRRTAFAARDFLSDNFLDEISLLVVLNSTNNYLPYFAQIPAIIFAPPNESSTTYDVSGVFTVITGDGGALIICENAGTKISITQVKPPDIANADINITYGFSVHAGEFSGLVINTARRQELIAPDEINAYYEKIDWILE